MKQYAEINNKWIVLTLHSTLSLAEQEKVFDYPPDGIRHNGHIPQTGSYFIFFQSSPGFIESRIVVKWG